MKTELDGYRSDAELLRAVWRRAEAEHAARWASRRRKVWLCGGLAVALSGAGLMWLGVLMLPYGLLGAASLLFLAPAMWFGGSVRGSVELMGLVVSRGDVEELAAASAEVRGLLIERAGSGPLCWRHVLAVLGVAVDRAKVCEQRDEQGWDGLVGDGVAGQE